MRRSLRCVPLVLAALSLVSIVFLPRGGETVPLYAARQGLMCQTCHFDPNGGGPRNEFGFGFAKNRHRLEPEGDTSTWKDLTLTNRVGENLPVYLGLNQRFMLLANQQEQPAGTDRVGFFDMENAWYLTFQPHSKLTLVYARDGFNTASRTKEAFGLIGLSGSTYLKAGQFRVPFGLRQDDHTVATRNGFLDFQTGESFLPFDPREVDQGLEVGTEWNGWFGRTSITNGDSDPFNTAAFGSPNNHAQAVAAKLGYNMPQYQGGISLYDDFHFVSDGLGGRAGERQSRWGYYGMTHAGPFALIGELAAGTDKLPTGEKVNKFAGYGELNWSPSRPWNFRVRYDRLELNRSSDEVTRELNTYSRYAVEGEWVPVPFAEIRATLRLVDPKAEEDLSAITIRNEKQAYVQFHFSY